MRTNAKSSATLAAMNPLPFVNRSEDFFDDAHCLLLAAHLRKLFILNYLHLTLNQDDSGMTMGTGRALCGAEPM